MFFSKVANSDAPRAPPPPPLGPPCGVVQDGAHRAAFGVGGGGVVEVWAGAGPVAGAVGASALVAATAARDVVPSVALVLGGLVAAVAALVVTTRAHRDEQA